LFSAKALALLPLKGENIIAWGIAPGLKRLTSTSPERARHNLIFVSPFQGLIMWVFRSWGDAPGYYIFPFQGK